MESHHYPWPQQLALHRSPSPPSSLQNHLQSHRRRSLTPPCPALNCSYLAPYSGCRLGSPFDRRVPGYHLKNWVGNCNCPRKQNFESAGPGCRSYPRWENAGFSGKKLKRCGYMLLPRPPGCPNTVSCMK